MEETLWGIGSLVASLGMGALKKHAIKPGWGPNNNAIPITNPLMVGGAAWASTGSVETTAISVACSVGATLLHQGWKWLFGKKG